MENIGFVQLHGMFGEVQPGLIKSEPMALATGLKATNVPVLTPEASAYGSQNNAFLSGQGQPHFETRSEKVKMHCWELQYTQFWTVVPLAISVTQHEHPRIANMWRHNGSEFSE